MKFPSLVQERYHAIAPCLAEKVSTAERARNLDLSYATFFRWLQQFRQRGMKGLFDLTEYVREPYTPEHIIVTLLYNVAPPKLPIESWHVWSSQPPVIGYTMRRSEPY
jgi:winged helix-turn helix protein